MVVWNGKVYLSATVCYQKDGRWNAAGLEIQRLDFQQDAVRATHFWNTIEKGVAGIQKNWLPVPDKPFHYIVGTSRSGAQHIDISTGEVFDVGEIDKKVLYRGNTPLVEVDGGYVAITHVVDMDAPVKTYVNHVVKYDKNLCPVSISRPFKLTEKPIEFVTDLKVIGNEVLIGVTENDDTPLLLRFNKDEFFSEVNKTQEVDEHEITI